MRTLADGAALHLGVLGQACDGERGWGGGSGHRMLIIALGLNGASGASDDIVRVARNL